MGMFAMEPQLEDHFARGSEMVLHGIEYTGTINTEVGPAERTVIDVTGPDGRRDKYSVLGVGIANQAKRAESGDFPAVVRFVENPHTGGKTLKVFELIGTGAEAAREWQEQQKS